VIDPAEQKRFSAGLVDLMQRRACTGRTKAR
jgi:hypothetical protein